MFGDPRLPARFWSKVTESARGCWEWQGATDGSGYGKIGMKKVRLSPMLAHRVAYEALVAAIPPGLDLDHLCRVRGCCNPAHLEPVTRAENLRRGAGRAGAAACLRGHPFDEANTYRYTDSGDGYEKRRCRACQLQAFYKARDKRRAAAR